MHKTSLQQSRRSRQGHESGWENGLEQTISRLKAFLEPKEFLLLTVAQSRAKISGQLIQEGKYFASPCVRTGDLSNISHWTGGGRTFPGSLCLTNSWNSPVISQRSLINENQTRGKAFIKTKRNTEVTTYFSGEFHPGLSAEIISTEQHKRHQ